jgi:hypothetical protein
VSCTMRSSKRMRLWRIWPDGLSLAAESGVGTSGALGREFPVPFRRHREPALRQQLSILKVCPCLYRATSRPSCARIKEGFDFLPSTELNLGGILADDMGLGKL